MPGPDIVSTEVTVSMVVPMHNEAEGLDQLFAALLPVLRGLGDSFEIVCIDDGSTDATLKRLHAAKAAIPELRVIELARNFGKEAALTAGLDHAIGRAVIPFDADLQDPPEMIPAMIAAWRDGHDVVLARRRARDREGWLKRATAWAYYRTHNLLAEQPIPRDVGDFRLLDRSVVEALKRLPERRRFMKGLFAWVGFRSVVLDYDRPPRMAGTTSWNYWRLWNLALEGLTSFSSMPLRIWSYLGGIIAMIAFAYATVIILRTMIHGVDVPGYASLLTVVLFMGGLQLLSLGLLGEYVGRIYNEVKDRPIYLVRRADEPRPTKEQAVPETLGEGRP